MVSVFIVMFVSRKQYAGAVARMKSTFNLLKQNEAGLERFSSSQIPILK